MSYMLDPGYLILCKLIQKGSNYLSDHEFDTFVINYKLCPLIIQKNDFFFSAHTSITKLLGIYTHNIQQKSNYTSWVYKVVFQQSEEKLEDIIFGCFENIQLNIETEIKSTKMGALLQFAYSISSSNSANINAIEPLPSDEKIMLISLYNDALNKFVQDGTNHQELLGMWKQVWALSSPSILPNDSKILSLLMLEKQRLLERISNKH